MPYTLNPDAELARTAAAQLTTLLNGGNGPHRLVLSIDGAETLPLPSEAARLLHDGLASYQKPGEVVPHDFSLPQAAEILNMSPQFVLRLLDEGTLPANGTGPERRIALPDLMAYKRKSDADRTDALRTLVAEAQDFDMGY